MLKKYSIILLLIMSFWNASEPFHPVPSDHIKTATCVEKNHVHFDEEFTPLSEEIVFNAPVLIIQIIEKRLDLSEEIKKI